MSFFDDKDNFGLMIVLSGLISILASILWLAIDLRASVAVSTVGGIITGTLILLYGLNVRSESDKLSFLSQVSVFVSVPSMDKPGLLSGLLWVFGITTIIGAVFGAVSAGVAGDFSTAVASLVLGILIGLCIIWAAPQVRGEDKGFDRHLLWIILLILFVIWVVFTFFGMIGLATLGQAGLIAAIAAIPSVLISIFCLLYLVSPEVKSAMNV
jgi:hypothetical protein